MPMEVRYIPSLVALSVAVAILASYVALNLAHSVWQSRGRAKFWWLSSGALAMGVGIWSMHFIGMLACEMPGMEMAYDKPLMILSIMVAVLGSALALYVVSQAEVTRTALAVSGVAMAAAISGMHYIGMYSMRMAARIEWNYPLVALSILIALAAAFAALNISIRLRQTPERQRLQLAASVVMGIAIAGMHYVGMLAATFVHDSRLEVHNSNLLVSDGLTVVVTSATLFILGLALAGSLGQRLWSLRDRQNQEKYRLLVEAIKDYAIYILDPQGRITTWNSGAERILGYGYNEIIGRHVSTLFPEDHRSDGTALEELRLAKETGHFELNAIRVRKDGSHFWANLVIDPLYDKSGNLTGFSKVMRDITQARSLNEQLEQRVQERTLALQQSESQLRTIANAMPVLVAQLDRDQRFLFANDMFCDWFSTTHAAIAQVSFKELLNDYRYPQNQPYIERVLQGEVVTYERKSTSGGRTKILNVTMLPEFESDGRVKGFIVVAGDVSNYKEIEAELKLAKEAAEIANSTKSAFLANMSHEIRTPLGAVMGFSELIASDETPLSERRKMIDIIKRNGKLLSTIINDILDLSKVEAGKLEIERVPVPLAGLLDELKALLDLEASNKDIRFTLTLADDVPPMIHTDPTRLRQILLNIIGNAMKFTPRGTVDIQVRRSTEHPQKIHFEISDTGTGIAAEQAERLFSPFTQADTTTTRRFGGTGLGLVLSKKLANSMGGDVYLAKSTPEVGSTFVISIAHGELPSGPGMPPEPPRPALAAGGPPNDLSHLKVLVVDDSPDNLILIESLLRLSGAKVSLATNGREAISRALEGAHDVVLMDLQMPEMDGYEATRELRARGYTRPIIALTAHAMKEERKRCLGSGFDEHLTKPIDRRLLIQTLTEITC